MDVIDNSTIIKKNPCGKVSVRITIFLLQIFNFLIFFL